MEKRFGQRRWRNLSKKRKNAEEKSKATRKYRLEQFKNGVLRQDAANKVTEEIVAPSEFSLLSNLKECLQYFEAVDDRLKNGFNVSLDLSGVKVLTAETILYLLSRVHLQRYAGPKRGRLSGNSPDDPVCKKILDCSGFWKFVNTSGPLMHEKDDGVFEIISDQSGKPVLLNRIRSFIENGDVGREDCASWSFEALTEATNNSVEWAYMAKIFGSKNRWWVMAVRDPRSDSTWVTVLDNGQGVPTTIRKNFVENLFGSDDKLILSALKGEYRTQTEEKNRGTGLPQIFEGANMSGISDLVIISRRGYVNASTGNRRTLSGDFNGTMISWRVQ